ncbi:hypothetical protein ES703_51447 [subsurface metagenome]
MGDVKWYLHTVAIADHVVMKHYAAHARKLYTARLHETASAFFESFCALSNLLTNRINSYVQKTPARKVPMRTQHSWSSSRFTFGTINNSSNVEAGDALKINFFNRVIFLVDRAMNDRIQGGLGWHRP